MTFKSMNIKKTLLSGFVGLSVLWAPTAAIAQISSNSSSGTSHRAQGTLSTSDRQLRDGRRYDSTTFRGYAGQQISIGLESASFDPYLALLDGNGNVIAENDDVSRSNRSAGIRTTLPANGNYTIVATAYSASNNFGRYNLIASGLGAQSSYAPSSASSSDISWI